LHVFSFGILNDTMSDSEVSPEYRRVFLQGGETLGRHRLVPLPTDGQEWKWRSAKTGVLTSMSDAALAARNAIEAIWPDHIIHSGTCGYHATGLWFKKYLYLFAAEGDDRKNIITQMQNDFNAYRNDCAFIAVAKILLTKMMEKWRDEYGEGDIADQWFSVWAKDMLTRVEMNEHNPMQGGFPTDNNYTEGTNRWDKEKLKRLRRPMVQFIRPFVELMEGKSTGDLAFGRKLKREVHSNAFYARVFDIKKRFDEEVPCCLNIHWDFEYNDEDARDEIKEGSRIIAAEHLINELKAAKKIKDNTKPERIKDTLLSTVAHWQVACYKALLLDPEETFSKCDFDETIECCKSYHVVQPVTDPDCITSCWHMLDSTGLTLMPLESVLEQEIDDCFMSCNCNTFRHYGWCQHSCAIALVRGIITKVPTSVWDPKGRDNEDGNRRVTKQKGRPPCAEAGGALKKPKF
jgi:hypothetical protein